MKAPLGLCLALAVLGVACGGPALANVYEITLDAPAEPSVASPGANSAIDPAGDAATAPAPSDQANAPTDNQVAVPADMTPAAPPSALAVSAVSACDNEYVTLYNPTSDAAQLDGWILRDETERNALSIGAHSLAPMQTVKIYTGYAPETATAAISIGRGGSGIFNNRGGDAVRLFAPSGDLIFETRYTDCGVISELESTTPPDGETDALAMDITPETQDFNLTVVCLHPQDDYVILRNDDEDPVNLRGWILRDAAARPNERTLPDYELAVGAQTRVYSQTAPADQTDAISLNRSRIWNDGGDTAYLYEPSGMEIDSQSDECDATNSPPTGEDDDAPPTEPQLFDLKVVCIHFQDDYVILRNNDDVGVNLRWWTLRDEADNRQTLISYDLEPGAEARVYSDAAPAGQTNAISLGGGQIWNNSRMDTARLYEPTGEIIDRSSADCDAPETEPPPNPAPPADNGATGGAPPPPQNFNLQAVCVHFQDDYVILRNADASAVNLLGWQLRDTAGNTQTLISYNLAPGAQARVYSDAAPDGQTDAISLGGRPIWNNTGDTAYLYEPSGQEIDSSSDECQTPMSPNPNPPTQTETGAPNMNPAPAPQNFNLAVVCIHLQDDYVILRNDDTSEVNLQGWRLRDAVGNTQTLISYNLAVGAEARVYSDAAPAGQTDAISLGGHPIWNNTGDTAYLYEPSGQEIDSSSDECQTPMSPNPNPPTQTETGAPNMNPAPAPQNFNLAIVCIHLQDEYVILRNDDSVSVNLQGWTLRDAANTPNEQQLPDYDLAMGAMARVYSQTAPDGQANAISLGGGQIWNNSGDTAYLYEPSGMEIDSSSDECPEPMTPAPDPPPQTETGAPPVNPPPADPKLLIVAVSACDNEYVEIRNADAGSVNLQGWILRDNTARNKLTISTERSLAADEKVKIYTGTAPADEPDAISIGRGSGIFNNTGGDSVRLLAPAEAVIDEVTYTDCGENFQRP